jgi:flagellar basal-body rod protein FlgG
MNRSMITATNTMTQLQKQLDNISHNIANVNTVGFKKRETNFQELLFQHFNNQPINHNEVGRLTPNGIRQGTGAKLSHTSLQLSQGAIITTERALDFALLKENQFFEIEVDGELRYTKDGSFSLSVLETGETQLVTGDGHPVLSETGPIIFGEGHTGFSISSNGELNVSYQDGTIGTYTLSISQIQRPQLLESEGNNIFGLPNLANLGILEVDVFAEIGRNDISVQQGSLEQSNVELQKEMTEMINTQRSYQFNARSISIADQMMGLVNGIR